jgi:hypothetical protein
LTIAKNNDNRGMNSAASTKTTTMTFRIYENVLRELRKEAKDREISINVLVNQVFRRYIEWDSYEPKIGMIPIAKPVVMELFENISEAKIIEIAQNVGKDAVKDIALFMKHRMNVESFLEWFETRMKTSSIEISHQRLGDTYGVHSYMIKHDLGKNWSIYHKTIFEYILQDVLQKPMKNVLVTPTMFGFEFEE